MRLSLQILLHLFLVAQVVLVRGMPNRLPLGQDSALVELTLIKRHPSVADGSPVALRFSADRALVKRAPALYDCVGSCSHVFTKAKAAFKGPQAYHEACAKLELSGFKMHFGDAVWAGKAAVKSALHSHRAELADAYAPSWISYARDRKNLKPTPEEFNNAIQHAKEMHRANRKEGRELYNIGARSGVHDFAWRANFHRTIHDQLTALQDEGKTRVV